MLDVRRIRARAKYRRFQNTITFYLRRILTSRLKLSDDIDEIFKVIGKGSNETCEQRLGCRDAS